MWRVLLVAALAGCSGSDESTGDGGAHTTKFTPILCTAGSPGDSTCPINHVDLGLAITLRASFVARPTSPGLAIEGFVLDGAASHVDGVYVEIWCPDCFQPLETKLVAATLATGATATTTSLSQYATSETLALRLDAIH